MVPRAEQESAPASLPLSTEFITNDPRLKQSLECLPTYAKSDLPILLTGEPGTGKELVVEAICALSRPWRRTCQRLNCASLTESLACSELFGHLRGAFTDANRSRPGKFRLAHGATLFLDEVGELPLGVQPKLLRAVEQGEIEPVGGDTAVKVNVRLIAATNQNLPKLVAQGRFRQDLLDRLAVLTIHLPPLRERLNDVALLARHFAREVGRRHGSRSVRFSLAAVRRLQQHSWPGNVRELKNVITRAVLFCSGGLIRGQDIAFTSQPGEARGPLILSGEFPTTRPTGNRLQELLKEEQGNISALSRRLQVCTKTIYRWLRRHGIDLVSLRAAAV
ncbi:MAG: sigma-54 dependent transcriptional regulator [Pseudomonadota bacterium]